MFAKFKPTAEQEPSHNTHFLLHCSGHVRHSPTLDIFKPDGPPTVEGQTLERPAYGGNRLLGRQLSTGCSVWEFITVIDRQHGLRFHLIQTDCAFRAAASNASREANGVDDLVVCDGPQPASDGSRP